MVYNETGDFKPPKLKRIRMRNTSLDSIRLIRQWLNISLIESIDFSDNALALNESTAAVFGTLVNLRELSLSNVGLSSMRLIRFDKLGQLARLDLSSNALNDTLDCAVLGRLVNLDYLELSSNSIGSIDSCLNGKQALRFLYLANNRIRSLGANLVEKLVEVDLSNNLLDEFPVFSFSFITTSRLANLKSVDLSSNLIRKMPPYEMSKLKEATRLELSNNRISKVIGLESVVFI